MTYSRRYLEGRQENIGARTAGQAFGKLRACAVLVLYVLCSVQDDRVVARCRRLMQPRVEKLSRSRRSSYPPARPPGLILACSMVAFRLCWTPVIRSSGFPAASVAAIHLVLFHLFFYFLARSGTLLESGLLELPFWCCCRAGL